MIKNNALYKDKTVVIARQNEFRLMEIKKEHVHNVRTKINLNYLWN